MWDGGCVSTRRYALMLGDRRCAVFFVFISGWYHPPRPDNHNPPRFNSLRDEIPLPTKTTGTPIAEGAAETDKPHRFNILRNEILSLANRREASAVTRPLTVAPTAKEALPNQQP